jgi:hypothetical protein
LISAIYRSMISQVLAAVSSHWKPILTGTLLLSICASVVLRAPREPIDRRELRRLVGAAVVLYVVGAAASLAHRGVLAGVVYATGILVCSLAVWLSRGVDRGDGGDGPGGFEPPAGEWPPSDPDGAPPFDWDEFERERARWGRERVG